MKRVTFFLSITLVILSISFTSCEKDEYLDWKYLNEQWFAQQKDTVIMEWVEGTKDTIIWKTTSSGLQYAVVNKGIGTGTPSSKSLVNVTYTGRYLNDSIFDSSDNSTMYVSEAVSGFSEGLKMMRKNSVYYFRIPWNLGYGSEAYGLIPPYTALQFRIVMNDFYTAQ